MHMSELSGCFNGRPRHTQGLLGLCFLISWLAALGCEASQHGPLHSANLQVMTAIAAERNPEDLRMWMTVGDRRFAITLADSPAARAFAAQMPLTLDMADLNRNEKHAELPIALPTSAGRIGSIRSGDLMLYGSTTLVVFYLTFESSYSYTRLGRVDRSEDLAKALGVGSARIRFSRN